MELTNKKLSDNFFFTERKKVLNQWKTGNEVDFKSSVEHQKSIPTEKRFGLKLAEAAANSLTLIQPRAGVALYEEHINLLKYLENEGEADLLPTTVDSYTRLNRYN
ncbi:MAG: methylaspartate mutase subunit E, partial [Bacteroidales bacterium]|nr:methylaspartate mutase subunit E [Bacteroidales bacterium]